MATRVNGAVGVGSWTHTLTASRGGVTHFKWEGGGIPASSITDSVGNVWTLAGYSRHTTGNEPGCAFYYCLNIATGGSATFTAAFASGSGTFLHCEVEVWLSATGSFALDGSPVFVNNLTNGGAGYNYNSGGGLTATATGAGVAFFAVSDYNSLGTLTGGGTPSFAVGNGGNANGDSFLAYASVTGAGAVTPAINCAGGATRPVMGLLLLKESTGGTAQDLAGAATGGATATGAAAVTKPLAGGATGGGAATGALGGATQSLAGGATGGATATGAAAVGKPLGAGATGGASAAGQLQGGATLTLSQLKNNTGTVLANETGATVYVYTLAGALVVTKTGVTSNASGIVAVTDALLNPGTTYRVVIALASGAEGMEQKAAA